MQRPIITTAHKTPFQEKDFTEPLSMVLFLKSPRLILGGKACVDRGSLERYEGKSLPIELQGAQDKIFIHPDPSLKMQVIPLAGGDHFWGADFIVAFPLSALQPFKIEVK